MSEPLYCRTCATFNQAQRPRYGLLIPLLSWLLTLAGMAASGVRLLILGRALRSGVMHVPEAQQPRVSLCHLAASYLYATAGAAVAGRFTTRSLYLRFSAPATAIVAAAFWRGRDGT
ncbi:hypothetical protein O1Q74_07235 [Pectobacterium sp. A5351]|nr:hypothetical protein [Pectobacterium sp. A5351]WCG84421.1 hypothetical protein O1Q74_07235 [Pectobacterium sp. A5351]